jgi:hypothetical protein
MMFDPPLTGGIMKRLRRSAVVVFVSGLAVVIACVDPAMSRHSDPIAIGSDGGLVGSDAGSDAGSGSSCSEGGGGPDDTYYDVYTADVPDPGYCSGPWDCGLECLEQGSGSGSGSSISTAAMAMAADIEFLYVVIQNETGDDIIIQLGKKDGDKFKSNFQTDKITKDQNTNDKAYKKKIDTTSLDPYKAIRAVDKDGNGVEGYTVKNSTPEYVRDGDKVGIAVKFTIAKKK